MLNKQLKHLGRLPWRFRMVSVSAAVLDALVVRQIFFLVFRNNVRGAWFKVPKCRLPKKLDPRNTGTLECHRNRIMCHLLQKLMDYWFRKMEVPRGFLMVSPSSRTTRMLRTAHTHLILVIPRSSSVRYSANVMFTSDIEGSGRPTRCRGTSIFNKGK